MDGRDLQIDALRGFAIILVIMGHVIAFSSFSDYQYNLLFNIIYSFHMPLFFMISGYLVFGHFKPTTIEWLKKKFMGLIIPYIIFTFVYFYVLGGFYLDRITISGLISSLFSYTNPNSAWFLPVLFETFIVLAILINIEKFAGKKTYFLFIALSFLAITVIDPKSISGVNQIIYYSPFVVIGYLINEYKESAQKLIGIGIPVGSLLFPVLFSLRYTPIYNYLGQLIFLYYYALAICGIILSYFIVKMVIKTRASSILVLSGVFSMELYLTHLVVLYYSSFFHIPLWFGPGPSEIISGTVIVFTIALALSLLLSYNKVVSTLLFGRWSYRLLKKIRPGTNKSFLDS